MGCLSALGLVSVGLLVCGLLLICEHPILMCGILVGSYSVCMVTVGLTCNVVSGCVVFLVGVGGILVALLYVTSLCGGSLHSQKLSVSVCYVTLMVGISVLVVGWSYWVEDYYLCEMDGFGKEGVVMGSLGTLLPLVGLFLFLCVVGVVYMCRTTSGCVGGMGVLGFSKVK
uniref:NADH dehydrogenase subunit 6 n=1 Tax=Macoma balthica TaxID=1903275 RepID=A0A6B7FS33_MACBL|nr:NADH dehydrogenase subunit 6 [Macoma balthica]